MKSGGIQFKLRRDLHSGFYDADNNLQSARTDGNKANIITDVFYRYPKTLM